MSQWAIDFFEKLAIGTETSRVYKNLVKGVASAPASVMGPRSGRFEYATPIRITGTGAHITDPNEIKARKQILGGHIKDILRGRENLTPQEREAIGSEAMGRFRQSIEARERTITPASTRQSTVIGRGGIKENPRAVEQLIARAEANKQKMITMGAAAMRQQPGKQVPTPSQAAVAAGLPQLSPTQTQGSIGSTVAPVKALALTHIIKPHQGGRQNPVQQVATPPQAAAKAPTLPQMKKNEFWAMDYCKQADIPVMRSIWSVLADRFKQDDEPDAPKTKG